MSSALITGGSSGIGFELARIFAEKGYDIIIVARNSEALKYKAIELSHFGAKVKTFSIDLSKPDSANELFEKLKNENIEILVNNAGFGLFGEFAKSSLETDLEMMYLNMQSLTILTKLFLTQFLIKKRGKILNIASTAAFQPGPLMAVYYATKAYVLSFSEAVANEIEGTKVSLTVLCPGPTKSSFQKTAHMDKKVYDKAMDVKKVAKAAYDGLMKRKVVVIPGIQNRISSFLVHLLPRKILFWIVKRVNKGEL